MHNTQLKVDDGKCALFFFECENSIIQVQEEKRGEKNSLSIVHESEFTAFERDIIITDFIRQHWKPPTILRVASTFVLLWNWEEKKKTNFFGQIVYFTQGHICIDWERRNTNGLIARVKCAVFLDFHGLYGYACVAFLLQTLCNFCFPDSLHVFNNLMLTQ